MKISPRRLREGVAGAVTGLSLATAIGQGIVVVVAVLLARVMDPRDFAVYGVYLAIFSWTASLVCLRYEQAIILPSDERDATAVYSVAWLASIAVAAVTALLVLIFGASIAAALHMNELRNVLFLLPFALLVTGITACLTSIALRRQAYEPIMLSRLAQGIGTACGQVLLVSLGFAGGGLAAGDAVGRAAAAAPFIVSGKSRFLVPRFEMASMRRLARRYRRFPLISAPSSLINSAGLLAPIILLTALYGPRVGGLLTLAQRFVGIPMELIANAVSQVYDAGLSSRLRSGAMDRAVRLFEEYTSKLFRYGTLPILILALVGPWIFGVLLGERWEEAGRFTRALAPLFLASFIATPLSHTLTLLERQGLQFAWDVGRLATVVGVIIACHARGWSALGTVAAYSIFLSGWYVLLWALGYWVIRRPVSTTTAGSAGTTGPSLDHALDGPQPSP